jgi:hypothetical protein
MAIQYDPRLQGKQNTTDILTGQESVAQEAQEAPQSTQQPQPGVQPSPAQQSAPQSNLAVNQPKSSPRSGMFTNVKQYMERNVPASQKLAESVGQTVQRSSDIARKNIQASQKQFENLMDQGSLADRAGAVEEVRTAATTAAGMQSPQQPVAQVQPEGDQPAAQPAQPAQPEMSAADRRLKSILDAAYTGPQRLQELGSFGQAQSRAQEAERLRGQLTSGRSGELLEKALERPGSRYTQGARRLDELLFGSSQPQQRLQEIQQQIGDVGQDLTGAISGAQSQAMQRAAEMKDIRGEARQALQDIATGRASDVEDYITGQIEAGGQLADYYRDILSGADSGLELGALEAETLGVKSGAGLYNLLRDPQEREALLGTIDARDALERGRLVSRDQQAQLAELQRLAQLSEGYGVQDSGLDFRSAYQDADLAQTQDALAALNLEGFGRALTGAEERFREDAARDITGVGRGQSKYHKGLMRGRGTVKKTAYESANLKDILEGQGYDFESDPSQYVSDANVNILRDLSKYSKGQQVDVSDAQGLLDKGAGFTSDVVGGLVSDDRMADAITAGLGGAGIAALAAPSLAGLGAAGGGYAALPSIGGLGALGTAGLAIGGAQLGSQFAQSLGSDLEKARIFGDVGATIGRGLKDVGREVETGLANIFGGGKSKARKIASAKARQGAVRDLERKLKESLSGSGFTNRLRVADTEATRQRQQDLMDILGQIDTRPAQAQEPVQQQEQQAVEPERTLDDLIRPARSGGMVRR